MIELIKANSTKNMRIYKEIPENEKNTFYILMSYQSPIIEYHPNTNIIKVYSNWNYGTTTRKHLSSFLKEYTPLDYSIVKKAILKVEESRKIDKTVKGINVTGYTKEPIKLYLSY